MLNNITLGQYFPTGSIIHRLDPRTKILSTFMFIMMLFFVQSLWVFIPPFVLLSIIIYLSKVPIKMLINGMKTIVFIILFTVILNMFFTPGKVLVELGPYIRITEEGVWIAVLVAVRLILLLIASTLMTLTTSPIQLTDGIESLLKPFGKIGVPAHEIAMMMTIALRFIPTLLEETDKIMKAQKARGADFETGGLMKRARNMIPLLVPLFVSAFRRADELAVAMEARCYRGGENRTRMKQLLYTSKDYFSFGIIAMITLVVIVLRFV